MMADPKNSYVPLQLPVLPLSKLSMAAALIQSPIALFRSAKGFCQSHKDPLIPHDGKIVCPYSIRGCPWLTHHNPHIDWNKLLYYTILNWSPSCLYSCLCASCITWPLQSPWVKLENWLWCCIRPLWKSGGLVWVNQCTFPGPHQWCSKRFPENLCLYLLWQHPDFLSRNIPIMSAKKCVLKISWNYSTVASSQPLPPPILHPM